MGNIIITGATSFLGTHLIEKLITTDNEIYALVRKESAAIKNIEKFLRFKNFHVINGDMSDYSSFKHIEPINAVFLLAWKGTRGASRMDVDSQKESYVSTVEFVKHLIKNKISNIIGIGSQAEYGISDEIKSESSTTNPNTQYGIYKLKTYNSLLKICKDNSISLKWFRLFSCYGTGDYEQTLVIDSLKKLRLNQDLDLSTCTQSRNFINVNDVVDIIIKLFDKNIRSGAYNLASNDTRILADFVYEMKGICNSTSKLNFGNKQKNEKLMNLLPDNSKLLQVIGKDYKFKPFYLGIKEILDTIK